jgi:hypothetical protein
LIQEHFQAALLASSGYNDPQTLNRYEGQVFARKGGDGIIAEIFSRFGSATKAFVGLRVANGT